MMDKTTEHDYRAALDFLYGRINFERSANMPYSLAELKLARMTRLLELVKSLSYSGPTGTVASVVGTRSLRRL